MRMEIYAKSYDVKVWRVIQKGNYPLPAAAQPPVDPENIDEYTDEQMAVVQVNAKARNLLYNAISGEEYRKISSCDTAKEMWDKLEVTYEGTSKVKETHINMLVHDYELFHMKEGEYIEEMFARFSKIISDLKAFGKPYSSGDQVRKILRSLTTTWQTKVFTLESLDLNKLSYYELRGELIAFEKTHLKKTNREEKKKTVAFKATTERADNDIDDDPEALQEEIAMVSRGFNKNKSFGSWSDEDSSEHEEIANLCFMTILENDMNKLSGCWTDEDTSDDNENCFMARGETSKRLNKEVKDWKLKLEVCKIEKVLQDEFQELQMQLNGLRKSTSHSSVKSNQATYKSTGEGPARTESTSDKNLFKEVTKIDGGSVKFGDDSKGKIVGTGTVPFNNNCDITKVYLVDRLNYNLLSISQLCDSGYEVKFKKTCCAIEDKTEESVHDIFDENNTSAEKGTVAGDEDQIQKIQETSKSQESTNKPDGVMESTNEISNSQSESPKESNTHTSTIRPNKWRGEPEYPQKFIIGDPSEGMKARGALKKKANIALIS
uniref:Retrovirus-related Pol polyprotein from transposon TNT 1-94-like beta-barrel domain-containing protein n=1 Tax=Nicotiana tabacum TaxID=4097 RepID=A0A1S3XZD3_TOBAC|nr:PREDICTED: uncharacterized protein LOC107770284 [Nicotiana tabacum]